jgi:hypothetical protein
MEKPGVRQRHGLQNIMVGFASEIAQRALEPGMKGRLNSGKGGAAAAKSVILVIVDFIFGTSVARHCRFSSTGGYARKGSFAELLIALLSKRGAGANGDNCD